MNTPIDTLKAARNALLKLHRELIESERAVYERTAGPIPSPSAFLQLLTSDPWFEWLRPFSTLIATIDEATFDKKNPLTDDKARELLDLVRALPALGGDEHGAVKIYREALDRNPHALAPHSELQRLLGR